MVAKIGRGSHVKGVLFYNLNKVDSGKAKILFTNNMLETADGSYSVRGLYRSFEPYLWINQRTEKPVLHISTNPDPKDKVSDDTFQSIAKKYMEQMGYGNQPFVVFKHTDTKRTHIHIVSISVDQNGKKLPDSFDKRRSMSICRDMEQRYHLIPVNHQDIKKVDKIFRPVDYEAGDIKSQIASVVRYLPKYYKFQSIGGYNALLSLFNITTEEIKGTLHGQQREGLVYFALNKQGQKASNPFKASLFGRHAGHKMIQEHIIRCKQLQKSSEAKLETSKIVAAALQSSDEEKSFTKQLGELGINVVVRRNATGHVYGITFIDHNLKTVWNGSHLAKELSANAYNDWWNSSRKPVIRNKEQGINALNIPIEEAQTGNGSRDLFDVLAGNKPNNTNHASSFIENVGGIMPAIQGEDYEELAFAHQMKKKKKRKKRQ